VNRAALARLDVADAGHASLYLVAESLGVVPGVLAADSLAGQAVTAWWEAPRRMGCEHAAAGWARRGWWTVLLPDERVWCPGCAAAHVSAAGVCAACWAPLPDQTEAAYVSAGGVRFAARWCASCTTTSKGARDGEDD